MMSALRNFVSSPAGKWAGASFLVLAVTACSELTSSGELDLALPATEELAEVLPAVDKPAKVLAAPVTADFTGLAGWYTVDGASLEVAVADGVLVVPGMSGYNYGERIPVEPGDKFVVTYQVTLPPTDSAVGPLQYVVGPLFRNAANEELSWGEVKAVSTGGVIEGVAEGIAPDTAVSVQLYLGGMWSAIEPLPTATISYSAADLKQVNP